MENSVKLTLSEVHAFATTVLTENGLGTQHARTLADSMTAAERDECRSHGLFRLIMCVNSLHGGKVNVEAVPEVRNETDAVVIADAKNGFSLLAFEMALPRLIEMAKTQGVALLAIRNCYHFSALWPEVEAIAAHGLVGLATNPSHAWVAPPGGKAPVMGTNPLAFSWPRPNREPFVFDFATSAMARGEIEMHRAAGKPLPPHTAIDATGHATLDPEAALAGSMLPFGGHKGFALSLMIELLAGPLIGSFTSQESLAHDAGDIGAPFHGELIIAMDPARLGGGTTTENARRAEHLLNAITDQGARLPSQRRYQARARTAGNGFVTVDAKLFDRLRSLRIPNDDARANWIWRRPG